MCSIAQSGAGNATPMTRNSTYLASVCLMAVLVSAPSLAQIESNVGTITVGASREQVVALLGPSPGRVARGDREILMYPQARVTVQRGKVVGISWLVDPATAVAAPAAPANVAPVVAAPVVADAAALSAPASSPAESTSSGAIGALDVRSPVQIAERDRLREQQVRETNRSATIAYLRFGTIFVAVFALAVWAHLRRKRAEEHLAAAQLRLNQNSRDDSGLVEREPVIVTIPLDPASAHADKSRDWRAAS